MKSDPEKVKELYMSMLERLGIPLNPEKATIQHAMEVLFLTSVSQSVNRANNADITFERRKQLLLEIIQMDEDITRESKQLADEVVKSKYN